MVTRTTPYNSRFAKAGVSCFYDSEVLNSSFVHLMKFRAKNPRLRKAANRCESFMKIRNQNNCHQKMKLTISIFLEINKIY